MRGMKDRVDKSRGIVTLSTEVLPKIEPTDSSKNQEIFLPKKKPTGKLFDDGCREVTT